MSSRRRSYSLEGLQAATRAGLGSQVAERLLGVPVAPGEVSAPVAVAERPTQTPDWAWQRPADWAYRTTMADIREEALAAVEARCKPHQVEYVRDVLNRRRTPLSDQETLTLERQLLAEVEARRADVSQGRIGRPKVLHGKPRGWYSDETRALASPVVVQRRGEERVTIQYRGQSRTGSVYDGWDALEETGDARTLYRETRSGLVWEPGGLVDAARDAADAAAGVCSDCRCPWGRCGEAGPCYCQRTACDEARWARRIAEEAAEESEAAWAEWSPEDDEPLDDEPRDEPEDDEPLAEEDDEPEDADMGLWAGWA